MVAREGFVYEEKPLSITRNVVVWEGWSLVRVVVRQGFYCTGPIPVYNHDCLGPHIIAPCIILLVDAWSLKLKFRKYPSIHTNYIISHSTILQYNHNIWYGSYAEKKYWTRKTMISTGLPYLQFSMNSQGFSPARFTWPTHDGGRKRENRVWSLRNLTLDGKLCLCDDKKCCLCIISPSLAMESQPEKRRNVRPQQQEVVSDWLTPFY